MAKDESIFEGLSGEPGAVTPPPRSRFRRQKKTATTAQRPRMSDKDLRKILVTFFQETAPGIAAFAGDEYDAKVIAYHAERLADSYIALADSSPRFRALLETAASAGGPFAGAVFATVAVALPILHHHRVISLPPMFGLALIGEPLESHTDAPDAGRNGHDGTTDIPDAERPGTPADAV